MSTHSNLRCSDNGEWDRNGFSELLDLCAVSVQNGRQKSLEKLIALQQRFHPKPTTKRRQVVVHGRQDAACDTLAQIIHVGRYPVDGDREKPLIAHPTVSGVGSFDRRPSSSPNLEFRVGLSCQCARTKTRPIFEARISEDGALLHGRQTEGHSELGHVCLEATGHRESQVKKKLTAMWQGQRAQRSSFPTTGSLKNSQRHVAIKDPPNEAVHLWNSVNLHKSLHSTDELHRSTRSRLNGIWVLQSASTLRH